MYKILFTVTDDNNNSYLVTKIGYTKYPSLRFRDLVNEYKTDYIHVESIYIINSSQIELAFHKKHKESSCKYKYLTICGKYRKELYFSTNKFNKVFNEYVNENELERIY